MFQSKILRKFLALIGSVLLIYTGVTLFVAVPKIDNTIKNLEEKNAKLVLDKVVMLTENVAKDLEHFRKELFHTLREIMNHTKIGKSGYIYIFDSHRMIIHTNSNIDGKNFKKLVNPGKGTYIYDDLVKAAHGTGVLRYKWDKPSDKGHYIYDKISWIRYVPSMDLYVVSSAYADEFESVSRTIHNQLLYLGLTVLLLTLLLSMMLLRYLLRPVEKLAQTASVIAEGNYHIRASVDTSDEIGELARNFNTMVDRLEEQIKTLDLKVKEKTEELRELAITDPLTKLFNRRYFAEVSPQVFSLAKRDGEPLSVMMLDIDRFKKINDTYGHQNGDRVIETLAQIVTSIKRESDIACRYGGEEFILLLPKTSREGALKLAQRIRKTMESHTVAGDKGEKIQFTVSVGVSQADYEKDGNIEAVIKRADDAMYQAKKEGRNRACAL